MEKKNGVDEEFFYHTDHLGSNSEDCGGTVRVSPFGLEETTVTGDDTLTFTGKMQDNPTGLMYFNARYYDPTLGRFITEDPVKDGTNWYVYCANCPLKYVDLMGLASWKVTEEWDDEWVKKYQEWVGDFLASYDQEIDCAGLAITAIIEFASANGLPVNLKYYDSSKQKYIKLDEAKKRMNALTVIDNTKPLLIDNAQPGDLIMTKYDNRRGHSRVIYSIAKVSEDFLISWYQGNQPPVIPELKRQIWSSIVASGLVYQNTPRRWCFMYD